MSNIYRSAADLIGRTPLLEVSNIEKADALPARLLLKLESRNPGGSAKDRVALSMILDAEEKVVPPFHSVLYEPWYNVWLYTRNPMPHLPLPLPHEG